MGEQANKALSTAIYNEDPVAVEAALKNGADPYSSGWDKKPALLQIIDLASCYTHKLVLVRPLVQAGSNFDLIREKVPFHRDKDAFDQSVLHLGDMNYREGDKECAAFLLANLIAYDLEEGRGYKLPIDQVLAGMGKATKIPGDIGEQTRMNVAQAITRNQHALVDYVATSEDPVAAFLRTCSDYPDADVWMKKIEPINPDLYSRPTQQFIDAVRNACTISKELADNLNNPEMGRILSVDFHMNSAAINNMHRSWKPPLPPTDKPDGPKPV